MKVRVIRTDRGIRCPCGRDGLDTWQSTVHKNDGDLYLSSHLPPGEHDPHNFCEHSHRPVDDGNDMPRYSIGTRTDDIDMEHIDVDLWQLGGRNDPDVPLPEYKTPRIPLEILGLQQGSQERRDRINQEVH